MSQKQRTSSPAKAPSPPAETSPSDAFDEEIDALINEEVTCDVAPRTPYAIMEAIAIQIRTAREARKRIEREGSVVRDMKGSVIPHPAVAIEAAAMKLYTDWIAKHAVGAKLGRRR
jgi:hypothetical protein